MRQSYSLTDLSPKSTYSSKRLGTDRWEFLLLCNMLQHFKFWFTSIKWITSVHECGCIYCMSVYVLSRISCNLKVNLSDHNPMKSNSLSYEQHKFSNQLISRMYTRCPQQSATSPYQPSVDYANNLLEWSKAHVDRVLSGFLTESPSTDK